MADVEALKDTTEAHAFLRKFLETQPLYAPRRFTIENAHQQRAHQRYWPDSLMFDCAQCGHRTTWSRYETHDNKPAPFELPAEDSGRAVARRIEEAQNLHRYLMYSCAHCRRGMISFWCSLSWDEDDEEDVITVRKHGQSPAWSIAVAPTIERALPKNALPFYKKALICSSQAYGLGAVAYFRRTVEEVVDHLLDLLEKTVWLDATQGNTTALAAIASARTNHQATERLGLIVDLLPGHLRVGGINPLARLYDLYSEGVHTLTDEQSIEVALNLRVNLDYVLTSLTDQLVAAEQYRQSITKAGRVVKRPLTNT